MTAETTPREREFRKSGGDIIPYGVATHVRHSPRVIGRCLHSILSSTEEEKERGLWWTNGEGELVAGLFMERDFQSKGDRDREEIYSLPERWV